MQILSFWELHRRSQLQHAADDLRMIPSLDYYAINMLCMYPETCFCVLSGALRCSQHGAAHDAYGSAS